MIVQIKPNVIQREQITMLMLNKLYYYIGNGYNALYIEYYNKFNKCYCGLENICPLNYRDKVQRRGL